MSIGAPISSARSLSSVLVICARHGPIQRFDLETEAWEDVPITRPYTENSRGLGVADLADALRIGRAPRASGKLARHVLDVMHAALESAAEGRTIALTTTAERPAPLEA